MQTKLYVQAAKVTINFDVEKVNRSMRCVNRMTEHAEVNSEHKKTILFNLLGLQNIYLGY